MREEILRKLFHLLALVYVAGALYLPRPVFLGLVAVLALMDFVFETLRLRNPAFAALFMKMFGGLIRPEEAHQLTAVFWMLLGILSAGLIIGPVRVLVTVYLFLIFGDGAASLIGKGLGGPKWPGSLKSVTGSVACFVCCLLAAGLMLRPDYSWPALLVVAAAATILEFGILPLNDNLTIPLGTSLVFLLIDRLPLGLR